MHYLDAADMTFKIHISVSQKIVHFILAEWRTSRNFQSSQGSCYLQETSRTMLQAIPFDVAQSFRQLEYFRDAPRQRGRLLLQGHLQEPLLPNVVSYTVSNISTKFIVLK
jgi:hypothetical protein